MGMQVEVEDKGVVVNKGALLPGLASHHSSPNNHADAILVMQKRTPNEQGVKVCQLFLVSRQMFVTASRSARVVQLHHPAILRSFRDRNRSHLELI